MKKLFAAVAVLVMAMPLGVASIASAVPPCIEEDGSGQSVCYWDAASRGNHQGVSHLVVND